MKPIQLQLKSTHLKVLYFMLLIFFSNSLFAQNKTKYDLVIIGGRVIDPESKLDGIRNIGVNKGHIAVITKQAILGQTTINAKGLVVAPGFIDMHVHGRTNKEQEFQLHDGLTTTLELEWGVENVGAWYEARKSKALINYGASVCWPFERFKAIDKYKDSLNVLLKTTKDGSSSLENLFNVIGSSYKEKLNAQEQKVVALNIKNALQEGGIGIGAPIGYLPKTDPEEFYQIFKVASENKAIIFSHVREPNIISIQEAISNAATSGAPLHLVHINSMSLSHIELALDMIENAKNKGIDVSTEMYPYTAASTLLQSAIFNDGWQQRLDMDYKDLQWVLTGERLTKESFNKYRATGGAVIMHMMQPAWLNKAISNKSVMIASDGMPYSQLAHPRTAGTFSRVLGKYVREDKIIDLNTAIAKMTLLPANRLAKIAPAMQNKGRLKVGADADITIFDAYKIIDKASFETGLQFSAGVEYVVVNGVTVLKNGATVENTFPGVGVYGGLRK
jgi:dihydroorotase